MFKLEKCPFCNGEAIFHTTREFTKSCEQGFCFKIKCTRCGVTYPCMEWIVVDKFVNCEGVKIIELKCPHCGYKETHTSDIGEVRTCYICGNYYPVRKDCQRM